LSILDEYVKAAPSPQNLIDLFAGEWSSLMPQGSGLVSTPGTAALFEDHRVVWALGALGGVQGQDILELGPLEAGHTFMLHNAGAQSITAIESNSRAFLKCLCIKEVLGLQRARFMLGDFVAYLRLRPRRFDTVIASGVLYHMPDPLELLELIAAATDRVFIWTHYYDDALVTANRDIRHKFEQPEQVERNGHRFEWVRQHYKDALKWGGFCGGSSHTSYWLTRASLLEALGVLGFSQVDIAFDQPDHPNGPSLALCARK